MYIGTILCWPSMTVGRTCRMHVYEHLRQNIKI